MTTILCIEDEAELRKNIVEELTDEGYGVKEACDGKEGLEMIVRYRPDLVLCDINMPNKNGYELLATIREKYPLFAKMPFIFVTALADRERVLAGMKGGADAYLTKPIDYDFLLATIEASLRQVGRVADTPDDAMAI